MTQTQIQEAIKKYSITLAEKDGKEVLKLQMPKSQKVVTEITAAKEEIIVELKHQQEERKIAQIEREAKWAKQREEQDAIDKPLLEAMHKKADELRATIPSDHIEVITDQTGDLDGDPILKYTADGIEINWQDVNHIGWASAIRPGALGSFASIKICSISKEKLEQIKTAKINSKNQKEKEEQIETDRITAIFAKAKETGEKQYITHYTADCNDPHEECSTDIITEWAMPDGTKTITRQHTW